MKIYLAAPLFSIAEREFNIKVCETLVGYGHIVYLPQAVEIATSQEIYDHHVQNLEWCDMVVAIIDGADHDSGTSFEVGYAVAKGKPVILVRSDFRSSGDTSRGWGNLMLVVPSRDVVHADSIYDGFDDLMGRLLEAVGRG